MYSYTHPLFPLSGELPEGCFSESAAPGDGKGSASADGGEKKGKKRKLSGSSQGKSAKMEAVELALEVGRKEAEKNDAIKFGVMNDSLGKLGSDLVDLQRKQFKAGKALLEECCGVADMKRRVAEFREKRASEMDICDDLEEFSEFDELSLFLEEFVMLDDLLLETKRRKFAADRIISRVI